MNILIGVVLTQMLNFKEDFLMKKLVSIFIIGVMIAIISIPAFAAKSRVNYRVYTAQSGWLPWVNGVGDSAGNDDYAGIENQPIQLIQCEGTGGITIKYRVHVASTGNWLPWVVDKADYAGIVGQNIDAVEMYSPGDFSILYRTSPLNTKDYFPWILETEKNSYAGEFGREIDKLQAY